MMNLIQLHTDQQAYEGITHSRWGASWNWRWRKVDDDEDRRFPSPEPQTGSRSGLPMKNRMWWRLRLVKHNNSFSASFSPNLGIYSGRDRASGAPRCPAPPRARREEARAPWWVLRTLGPLSGGFWLQYFLYFPK